VAHIRAIDSGVPVSHSSPVALARTRVRGCACNIRISTSRRRNIFPSSTSMLANRRQNCGAQRRRNRHRGRCWRPQRYVIGASSNPVFSVISPRHRISTGVGACLTDICRFAADYPTRTLSFKLTASYCSRTFFLLERLTPPRHRCALCCTLHPHLTICCSAMAHTVQHGRTRNPAPIMRRIFSCANRRQACSSAIYRPIPTV